MKRDESKTPPIIGGNSLIIIFASLCLTVMTLLMIHTALVDSRMSDASVRAVSDYYAADYEAEAIFARLRSGEVPPEVTVKDDGYYYECAVSESQRLAVKVVFEENEWKIIKWQTYSLNR